MTLNQRAVASRTAHRPPAAYPRGRVAAPHACGGPSGLPSARAGCPPDWHNALALTAPPSSLPLGPQICGKPPTAGTMLECTGCLDGYHLHCLNPPLEAVPEEDWFCPECHRGRPVNLSRKTATRRQKLIAQPDDYSLARVLARPAAPRPAPAASLARLPLVDWDRRSLSDAAPPLRHIPPPFPPGPSSAAVHHLPRQVRGGPLHLPPPVAVHPRAGQADSAAPPAFLSAPPNLLSPPPPGPQRDPPRRPHPRRAASRPTAPARFSSRTSTISSGTSSPLPATPSRRAAPRPALSHRAAALPAPAVECRRHLVAPARPRAPRRC